MGVKLKWLLNFVMLSSSTTNYIEAAQHNVPSNSQRNAEHKSSGEGTSVPYCGISATENLKAFRIVGGVDADPHEFPWMAKLLYDRSRRCAAALIADRYLVTAGHCVTEHKKGSSLRPRMARGKKRNLKLLYSNHFTVGLGAHLTAESGAVLKRVTKIILHPDYDIFASRNEYVGNFVIQTNDLAILRINPVEFSDKIVPVCLPPQGVRVKNNVQILLAGWGSTVADDLTGKHRPKLPRVLQKTNVKKISFAECHANEHVGMHLDKTNQLTEREIFCLIGNDTDSCQGDSGGPVVEKTHRGYRLVGLVSWGIGCNQRAHPAAYTQVSSYIDFLIAHTKDGKFLPYKH